MIMYCKHCGQFVTWEFVGKFSDDHNRVWEVYERPECAARTQYATG